MIRKQETQERRRLRRQAVAAQRDARAVERQAAWERRAGRRIFQWRGRRGDAVEVTLDFSRTIVIEFNPAVDRVENVGARAALQQVLLTRRAEDDLPD